MGGKSKKEGLCISSTQALKWKNEENSLLVLADPSTPTVTPLQPFEHDKMSSPGLIMQATNSSSRQGDAWVPWLYNLGLPLVLFLFIEANIGHFYIKNGSDFSFSCMLVKRRRLSHKGYFQLFFRNILGFSSGATI